MNSEIVEYNGISFCDVEMDSDKTIDCVAKFAKCILSNDEFIKFIELGAHETYDELFGYGDMYYTLKSLGINTQEICDFIDILYVCSEEAVKPTFDS